MDMYEHAREWAMRKHYEEEMQRKDSTTRDANNTGNFSYHRPTEIIVVCQNCGQKNRVKESLVGGIYRCGKCHSIIDGP